MLHAIVDRRIDVYVWNRLYRSDLWRKLRFPVGRHYEDVFVCFDVLNQCKKVVVLKESLYLYRKRPGSITAAFTQKDYADTLYVNRHHNAFLAEHSPEIFSEKELAEGKKFQFQKMILYYLQFRTEGRKKRISFLARVRQNILAFGKSNSVGKMGG